MSGHRRFRCQPESVTAAREFVRNALRDQPGETVDAAELMTSELATNCVRHAHTEFELTVDLRDHIRVEVRDTGGGQPRVRSPAPLEPTGRGLRIVEAMSNTWGVIASTEGKTVWFTLDEQVRPAEDSQRSARRDRDGSSRLTSPNLRSAVAHAP